MADSKSTSSTSKSTTSTTKDPEAAEVSPAEFEAARATSDEAELDRTHVPDDVPDELVKDHNEGSGSWWPDVSAKSSDPTAAATGNADDS